jgi:hypothetical protein
MQKLTDQPEMIAIRGWLDRLGQFSPLHCYSTRYVRQVPEPQTRDYVVELHDQAGAVLARRFARVEDVLNCGRGATESWLVTAYIGLIDGAARVILLGDGLVLWQAPVPEVPTLAVRLEERTVSREHPVVLHLELSTPGDGAFVEVIYQWGEGMYQVLCVQDPSRHLTIDLTGRPGGDQCRFVLHYSNGLRSATATTALFSLPRLGPALTIVEPQDMLTLLPGQPLELAGQVVDDEDPASIDELQQKLSWWFDDAHIGNGPVAVVMKPSPGKHRIRLRYSGADRAEATGFVLVERPKPGDPVPADEWPDLGKGH